jgi:hypothetical protein
VVIRLRHVWYHAGAFLTSGICVFGIWYFLIRTAAGTQRPVDCVRLMSQVREVAVATYSQQLRARLAHVENLPLGLNGREIWSLDGKEFLVTTDGGKVPLSGGQRLLQRDMTAAANAIQFACNSKLSSENLVMATASTAYRDLTIAAYDAAESDANSIRLTLSNQAALTAHESSVKPSDRHVDVASQSDDARPVHKKRNRKKSVPKNSS